MKIKNLNKRKGKNFTQSSKRDVIIKSDNLIKNARVIIENLNDGYYEVNLKGDYTYANPALCNIVETPIEDLINSSYRSLMDHNTAKKVYKVFNEVYRLEIPGKEFEIIYTTKNGNNKFVKASVNLLYDGKGTKSGYYGIIRDITQKKKTTELIHQLKASERKYRNFISSIKEGYYEVDLRGRYIYFNEALREMFDYTEDEMYNLTLRDRYSDKMRKEMIRAFKKIYKEEKDGITIQYEFKKKDGSIAYLETSVYLRYNQKGKKVGFSGLVRDIAEKKKMEKLLEQLEISEKKNRHFISSIKEGYYEINLKGDYEYVNIALCDILGFNIEEIYNINVRNQVDNDTKALFIKTFQKLVEKEEDGITIYYNFTKKNGDRIYLENTIYLRYDENGEIIGFTGLMRDQTKKKAMDDFMEELSEFLESEVQERTKELQESLKEKQKYLDEIIKSSQFKTNFMATMSHELRTPLNAIIGFTDLLLERMLGTISDLQEDYILDIKSSAELQLEMINGILDISKIEAGQINLDIQEFSLNYVLESVISSFKIQLDEKKLLLTKSNFNKDVKIKADPVRFKEIISNLLSNAIKYTIEGTIGIIFQETEQEWIFKIKDTGIGIAEEDHDLIFKEFKRVESDYVKSIQGSGLGLSLIKRLINLHGGNIWFESQLGKGSTFTFAIPKNREN